ncbi:MAG TPA: polynucleotide adenylyltransferase PcnB [Paenalcaligenes sp.]|nr:polynucleotide adenylyltransferase PcnB [Paenalcaligenes sp.]
MLTRRIKNFIRRVLKPDSSTPLRIAADEHKINKRHVSRHAIKVCEVLQDHGFEAYVVGGAVRDLLVGIPPKDFDVATNATPEQIRPLFRRAFIIGRRFKLVHVVFGREVIETSTFRAASNQGHQTDQHGRILRDNVYGTLRDDAARRDFTFNALYYDPRTQEVIDFHQGVEDLKNQVVRIIGDAETRFREDPVRMLRAIRFAAKLDAKIAPNTHAPIKKLAHLIDNVPTSRRFDEAIKLLSCGQAIACLKQLDSEGLIKYIFSVFPKIYAQEEGARFLDLAFERTDHRVRTGQSISPSFLFAALLWPLVRQLWQTEQDNGVPPIPAMANACARVLDEYATEIAIQRRFQSDMREIWFMQARFHRVSNRAIWRMVEQPRFRAAVDFLQLRAATREFDSVQAQWWMDLANGNYDTRAEMIAQRAPARKTARRRRRRGRRRNTPKSNPQNN